MSMYEIEGLMENTVRLIDKSEAQPSKKRNQIWNAYHLQNQFDCSFTHFRLMDVLIKTAYVQTYKLQDFPMYAKHSNFFAALSNKKFEWIRKNPIEKYSNTNLEIAYWDQKSARIYSDFGTPFYTQFSDEKPLEIAPLDFGLQIITLANIHKDKATVYDWIAFMLIYLVDFYPENTTERSLKEQYYSKIKTIFQQFDYTNYKALHEGLDLTANKDAEWLTEQQRNLIHYILS